jgi:hypothetical protein
LSVHTFKLRNTREEQNAGINLKIDAEEEELDNFLL